MQKLLFLYNPHAGKGKIKSVLSDIVEQTQNLIFLLMQTMRLLFILQRVEMMLRMLRLKKVVNMILLLHLEEMEH